MTYNSYKDIKINENKRIVISIIYIDIKKSLYGMCEASKQPIIIMRM